MYRLWLHLPWVGIFPYLTVVICYIVQSYAWACLFENHYRTGTALQEQNVCNFNLPLGNINDNLGGSVRLEFGDTQITASAAITVDSTSIIYTGYTNSSGNFVGVVRTIVYQTILYDFCITLLISLPFSFMSLPPHLHLAQKEHSIPTVCHLL